MMVEHFPDSSFLAQHTTQSIQLSPRAKACSYGAYKAAQDDN